MKILLVFLPDIQLSSISINFAVYSQGLRSVGLEPLAVCPPGSEVGYDAPVTVPRSAADFRSVEYWSSLQADVAIVLTWLRFGEELAAMRSAGLKVINLTDSDGFATAWSHPREWLTRMTIYQRSWSLKLRTGLFWLRRCLRPKTDIEAVRLSLKESDSVIVHSEGAIANLRRFTDHFPDDRFETKLHVVPYPINELFCKLDPMLQTRRNRIVAVGRWDDPQKAPDLLVRALETYLKRGGKSEIAIVGRGGEPLFASLSARYPQVRYFGSRTQTELRDLYLSSRSILFSSRWETGPIAVGEALASGCTLIGAPLINFLTYHLIGPYGRCSSDRSPEHLANAIFEEMDAWDRGERRPGEIAAFWRARLNAEEVCRQLLDSLASKTSAQPNDSEVSGVSAEIKGMLP